MEIIHKNIILADKVKICDGFFSRVRGLMFSKPLKKGSALIFRFNEESILETTVHMFFVFFSIDILWLDKNKKVVDIKRNAKPFIPLITPRKPAKYVIEMPKNTSKRINIGDSLEF